MGIIGLFSWLLSEFSAIMVRPLRAASRVNSFVIRSAKITKYLSRVAAPRIELDVEIKVEAVRRQQCFTSVSMLTLPSFSKMIWFKTLTLAEFDASIVPD